VLAACDENTSLPAATRPSTVVPMNAKHGQSSTRPECRLIRQRKQAVEYSAFRLPTSRSVRKIYRHSGRCFRELPRAAVCSRCRLDPDFRYLVGDLAGSIFRSPRFISVTTTATPVFLYNLQSDNTCLFPAHVRFLLQEKDDDLSGMNGKQYFRWFSNSVAHQLAPGTANPSASLTDLSQMDERIWRKSKCKCRRNGRF
jgi:hypothetical protein